MNYEYQRIQKTLKSIMKPKKATYETVSKLLHVSPATIKRRLNGDDLSLQQLKEFAEALSISFYELIELSKQVQREAHVFTEDQERFLSRELIHMLVFRLIISGHSFAQIRLLLKISEKEMRMMAKHFEKVNLVQFMPGDRFLPLVHFPFKWKIAGPLSKAYDDLILENLFSRIKAKLEAGLYKRFEFALGADAYKKFCREIEEVYLKYRGLSELQLSSKTQLDQLVSGILFIDRFSLWDTQKSITR